MTFEISSCLWTASRASRVCRSWMVLIVLAMSACSRSGPEIAVVEGVVTLDGKPLPEAEVFFRHDEGGRTSSARTDDEGRFELNYGPTEAGAIVGPNTVRVTTFVDPVYDDSGRLIRGTGKKELVPAKYNKNTELKVVVEAKRNTFQFDLVSK